MVRFSAVLLVLFQSFAFAQEWDGKSARREPGVSYLKSVHRMLQWRSPLNLPDQSAYSAAQPFKGATLPAATQWASLAEMQKQFANVRDVRWLTTNDRPGFLRRSSWLYPDDGCFARAGLAIMNLHKWKQAMPSKVFVFGDLEVRTKNSPSGSVSWWYHVAPLVEVAGQKYVLDPAIEPQKPLKLEEWLATMSNRPDDLQVAVCHSGTYSPMDPCNHDSDGLELSAQNDQISYLLSEWSRLEDLNRDPVKELGEMPPWAGIGNFAFSHSQQKH